MDLLEKALSGIKPLREIEGRLLLLWQLSHRSAMDGGGEKAEGDNEEGNFIKKQQYFRRIEVFYLEEEKIEHRNVERVNRAWVPIVSANQFKGLCRRSFGDYFCSYLGIDKSMLSNFVGEILFSGGPVGVEGLRLDNPLTKDDIDRMKFMLPQVGLFGATAIAPHFIEGSIQSFSHLYPYCVETVQATGYDEHYSNISARHLLETVEFNRRKAFPELSDIDPGLGLKKKDKKEVKDSSYIYRVQVLKKGTLLNFKATLSDLCTDIEAGVLTIALEHMKKKSPFLGGHNTRGMGLFHPTFKNLPDPEPLLEHLHKNRDDIIEYVETLPEILKVKMSNGTKRSAGGRGRNKRDDSGDESS